MTVETFVFLVISGLTLGSAALVVISRDLFHAGLYLVVSLFGVAGLFVLMEAFFLGGAQVVVYIGAIAILIILAIFFTPGVTQMKNILAQHWPVSLALAMIFFLMLISVVTPLMGEVGLADNWGADFTEEDPASVAPLEDIATLGEDLVDPQRFMLPFEVASVLLMAAMIGAVLLAHPGDDERAAADEDAPAVGD